MGERTEPANARHELPLDSDATADSGLRLGPNVDELEVLRSMLDLTPCAIFVKDLDAKFVGVNQVMLAMFGFEHRDEIYGLDDYDIHPKERADNYWTVDRQVLRTGVPVVDLEEPQISADGAPSLVRTSKLPVRDRHGEIVGLMGFSTDVTEPARVSAALADSEQRYALAAQATRDGIWDYDVKSNTISLSQRCAEIFDVPVVSGPLKWELLQEQLGIQQTERLATLVQQSMAIPSVPLEFDLEIALADGTPRCVNIVGTVVANLGEVSRIVGSAEDVTEERRREVELRRQARHDDLTGLQNRRALLEALSGSPGALLYLDLDSFKVVNDSLGHQAGDDLLIAVAKRLVNVIGDTSELYRLGGDEFAILSPQAGTESSLRLATQINDTLRLPFSVRELEIYTTASIGIVGDLGDDRDPTDLLRDADIALYEAKAAGKARASVFESSMRDRAEDALQLQMDIRRAVEASEFELHYQPIVDADSGAMVGIEALLRWRRPNGQSEPPSVFLPYLEESKLIVAAGRWVIDAACAQMAAWRSEHPSMTDTHLALNISRVQFDAPDLIDTISAALERNSLDPGHVVVEITETAVTERTGELRSRLETLRDLGVHIAIDDFGVGQSSLSALYDFPADILKIDRSFIERVEQGTDEPVVRAAIAIAQSLGMTTVAEGVETEEQCRWLVDHGCDRLQGYLLSRPIRAEDVPHVAAALGGASLLAER